MTVVHRFPTLRTLDSCVNEPFIHTAHRRDRETILTEKKNGIRSALAIARVVLPRIFQMEYQ